jgi:hypothetical protein
MVVSQSFTGTTPDLVTAVQEAVEKCLDQLTGDAQMEQAQAVASEFDRVAEAFDLAVPIGTVISGDVTISTGEVRPVFVQIRIGG